MVENVHLLTIDQASHGLVPFSSPFSFRMFLYSFVLFSLHYVNGINKVIRMMMIQKLYTYIISVERNYFKKMHSMHTIRNHYLKSVQQLLK